MNSGTGHRETDGRSGRTDDDDEPGQHPFVDLRSNDATGACLPVDISSYEELHNTRSPRLR